MAEAAYRLGDRFCGRVPLSFRLFYQSARTLWISAILHPLAAQSRRNEPASAVVRLLSETSGMAPPSRWSHMERRGYSCSRGHRYSGRIWEAAVAARRYGSRIHPIHGALHHSADHHLQRDSLQDSVVFVELSTWDDCI